MAPVENLCAVRVERRPFAQLDTTGVDKLILLRLLAAPTAQPRARRPGAAPGPLDPG